MAAGEVRPMERGREGMPGGGGYRRGGQVRGRMNQSRGSYTYNKKSLFVLVTVLALVAILAIWGIGKLIYSVIPVGELYVTGLTRYDEDEIICTAGLPDIGKRRQVDREAICEKLLASYPYLKAVHVKYRFPTGTVIEVEEETPCYYAEVAGEYYAMNSELKVLERAKSESRFHEAGLLKVVMPDGVKVLLGQTPEYGDDYLTGLLNEVLQSALAERVDRIEIEDRYHVSLLCDGIYTLYLGDIHNIAAKLEVGALMLGDGALQAGVTATLDISNPQKTSIRYNQAETTDVAGTP